MLFDHALAKINLTLDIIRKRPDGYHDLKMVMQSVSLYDGVTIQPSPKNEVFVKSGLHFLPTGRKNLASKAAITFWEETNLPPVGLEITLDKKIPVCAGLAGGSSDAAAVLRLLNDQAGCPLSPTQLAKVAEKVGSDVPYCVLGGTALAEGTGNILTPLPPLPPCYFVLCKPDFPISTPTLFGKIDQKKLQFHPDTTGMMEAISAGDLNGIAHRLYNVFEQALPAKQATIIADIKGVMIENGALGACMSGTGPTVFGLFQDESSANCATETLSSTYDSVFLTTPV
ncbi:MAG: 4-(cytidine 5'-diphospho)-2-C-methyl-D-erythritol kinase [Eubacteriales bacterium]